MNLNLDFRGYVTAYFSRLVTGLTHALDATYVRAWSNGYLTGADAGGNFDAMSRSFPALAAYLAGVGTSHLSPDGTRRIVTDDLVTQTLVNAFDPANPGYWGAHTPNPSHPLTHPHQHTVEAASMAYGAWLIRQRLGTVSTSHFRTWLTHFGQTAYGSNWQLFLIVNHSARKALGWDFDQAVIDRGWDAINAFEREDGYMTDGPEAHFDDYNWWVFGTHELMWLQMDGASNPALAERIKARIRRRLEDYPYYFGAGGHYTEYGRSLSYKFARLGLPLLAYCLGLWPHSAGMLQRLVRQHLAHYDNLGAIDRHTLVVRQELSAHGHPDVREPYINTGHPYWCMLAFTALWQIPSDDPFWTCPEEKLPAETAAFTRLIKPAGWILAGDPAHGHVTRYALGSRHGEADYAPFAAKYAKFEYRSHFPINIASVEGDFGPDASLCLADTLDGRGEHWCHPRTYESFAVTESPLPALRARHTYKLGQWVIPCDTILIPLGQTCLRVHRVTLPPGAPPLHAVAGGAPLGFAPGAAPTCTVDHATATSTATLNETLSLIRAVQGFARALRPGAFRGNEHTNLIHDRALTPLLVAELRPGPTVLACLTYAGKGHAALPSVVLNWTPRQELHYRIASGAGEVAGVIPPL